MSNETNYEVMEQEETNLMEETFESVDAGEESKGGIGLAVAVVAGVAALGGLAIAGVKKLRDKRAGKPKTKLKLVRVPVENFEEEWDEELEDDVIEIEAEVVEEDEK